MSMVTGSSFIRFVASGVFNTAFTYLVYLGLLRVLPYHWSYTLSYASGIVLAYALYRFFVFRRSGGRTAPLWVVAIHGAQYLLGLALVSLWCQVLELPAEWAPAFALAIQVPLTFLASRWVFRDRAPAGSGGS
ncbi:GtrA family protein [Caenimonas sedimenti]|uniref:GtrA family protein n=1 Tax=Caenimonas sedimenti TaxID=2596921 RepID=A0A562ZHW3_9BURK|nr:GtrA family protein [Caenimonas sedimenti]TWO67916.1 GtrA family protein [Caenimonas sedimenti]